MGLAIADFILTADRSIFDFGCGHGVDVRLLKDAGYDATGWDPSFSPHEKIRAADVVNLGYVVNVIEDPEERRDVLRKAYSLSERSLIVSALLTSAVPSEIGDVYADGILTRRGTFQKHYSQEELRRFIDSTLGVEAVAAAPGVFYVFRNEADRQSFLLSKVVRRVRRQSRATAPLAETLAPHRSLLDLFVAKVEELGRIPKESECPSIVELHQKVGTSARCVRICEELYQGFSFEACRRSRKEDLLVYIALSRFGRRPRFSALPEDLQWDIRDLFGSYTRACELGDELLFGVGKAGTIDQACIASPIGKLLPDDLYVHASAVPKLSSALRVYVGCGRAILGEVEGANIVKIHRHTGKISYLSYPGFDREAHPSLASAISINLRTREVWSRGYTRTDNPPILHRKETFVDSSYPSCESFEALTRAEEAAGVLNSGARIGYLREWKSVLEEKGLFLRGHKLCKRRKSAKR